MNPQESLVPRQQSELDEELADVRQQIKTVRRSRRLLVIGFCAATLIFAGSVVIAYVARGTKVGNGWIGGATFIGILWCIASIAIGVNLFQAQDSYDYTGAGLWALRIRVEQILAQKRELAIGNVKGLTATHSRYRESLPELVARYRGQANGYKRVNDLVQSYIIVVSLAISAITALFGSSGHVRIGIVATTLTVAIASSMGSFFKLHARSSQLQKTADQIETEFRAVELGIGDYKGLPMPEALQLFVEKVEGVRSEHMIRQRQLDQPSDLRHIDQSSIAIDRTAQS